MENNGEKLHDLDKLSAMAAGNEAFIQKMISLFVEETPKEIENMKAALNDKDYQLVSSLAHKIKPSLDYMCVDEMFTLVKEVELWEGNEETMLQKADDLMSKVTTVIGQLKQL